MTIIRACSLSINPNGPTIDALLAHSNLIARSACRIETYRVCGQCNLQAETPLWSGMNHANYDFRNGNELATQHQTQVVRPRSIVITPDMPRLLTFLLGLVLFISLHSSETRAQAPRGSVEDLAAETSATQTIELNKGRNFVSLTLHPGDLELESILEPILEHVVAVEDGAGRMFVPADDIAQFSTWDLRHAYKVTVSADVSLKIEGFELDEERMSLQLEEGWNLVPMYLAEGLSISEAFGALGDGLVRVMSSTGETYYPEQEDASDLTEIKPGQGYLVNARETTELQFRRRTDDHSPGDPLAPRPGHPIDGGSDDDSNRGDAPDNGSDGATGDGPGETGNGDDGDGKPNDGWTNDPIDYAEADTTVNTMADMLAIRGLRAGTMIGVRGYHYEGDGGGGTFDVMESNCTPDGGTCLIPEEHQSDVIEQRMQVVNRKQYLGGKPLVPESISLEIFDGSGSHRMTIPGSFLHGHRGSQRYDLRPFLDLTEASFHDFRHRILNYVASLGGGHYEFHYRNATSDLRLVRRDVTDTYNVRWFGAQMHHENPEYDIQPLIANLVNLGMLRGIEVIYLPGFGVYEYFGGIELADGMTIRGAGGTYLATDTDEFGNTFHPVRIKDQHTRLRVKDDEALKHLLMQLPRGSTHRVEPDAKQILLNRPTLISSANNVMSMGLEDIVLDGNWEGNREPFENRDKYGGTPALETNLRNSPGYAGFVSTNHGGNKIPVGQTITVKNAAILGFASNGVLGNINNDWHGQNVLLGNSVWNHVLYGANGEWTNLTFTGFAWTHATPRSGIIRNLVFERGIPSPYRVASDLMNIRGPDAYSEADAFGARGGREVSIGKRIEGFYVDLRGSGINSPFNGLGSKNQLRDGVVIIDRENNGVFRENGNGYQSSLYTDNVFADLTIIEVGGISGTILGTNNLTGSRVTGIRSSNVGGRAAVGSSFHISASARQASDYTDRRTLHIDDITDEAARAFIFRASAGSESPGLDVFLSKSSFNNTTNAIVAAPSNRGRVDDLANHDKLRIFYEDVHLNVGIDNYWNNVGLFFETGYFKNVYARNLDRYSEDSGSAPVNARGGERYVDVDTKLFWEPEEVNVREGSGASGLFDRYEIRNVNGANKTKPVLRIHFNRPLNPGESPVFNWDAAVKPFPDGFEIPEFQLNLED